MKPSIAVLLVTLFAQAHLRAQFMYNATDLGTLGGTSSIANSINNSGQVAGTSFFADDQAQGGYTTGAFGSLPLQYLGNLGGDNSYGQAINASGQIAGIGLLSDNASYRAFLYSPSGTLKDLGTLGGLYSYGYGINASGRVTGYSYTTNNVAYHAFLSGANGGALKDLGVLPGGSNSYAFAVNSSGQVVGYSDDSTGSNHAFISDANGGALHDLGTLGGSTSFAVAVNDSGQAVGRFSSRFGPHAFVSAANGGALSDLGTLGGFSSYGEGINSAGSVTGYSFLPGNNTQHAFLYKPSTGMVDVNSLLASGTSLVVSDAKSINDSGWIVGTGTIGNQMHAVLLTPILPSIYLTAVARASNGHIFVQGVGVPSKIHTVETTPNLTTAFSAAGTIMADSNGVILFEDTSAGSVTQRFYRIKYP